MTNSEKEIIKAFFKAKLAECIEQIDCFGGCPHDRKRKPERYPDDFCLECIAKTLFEGSYPLAFEAGKKAQKEVDQQEIDQIQRKIQDILAECVSPAEVRQVSSESKNQGMRELAEWAEEECYSHSDIIRPKRRCEKCWQAKLMDELKVAILNRGLNPDIGLIGEEEQTRLKKMGL